MNNNQQSNTPIIQKPSNNVLITILLVVITALVVGGATYYYQTTVFNKEKNELENRIEELEEQAEQANQSAETTEEDLKKTIAEKMIKNEEIRGFLSDLCHQDETDCLDNVFYKWENNRIAFLSILSEEEWKQTPFDYSSEIYKVDLNKGDVFRLSQFDGNYNYILNILK